MYQSRERYAPTATDPLELAAERAGRLARVLLCIPAVIAVALYIDGGLPDGHDAVRATDVGSDEGRTAPLAGGSGAVTVDGVESLVPATYSSVPVEVASDCSNALDSLARNDAIDRIASDPDSRGPIVRTSLGRTDGTVGSHCDAGV